MLSYFLTPIVEHIGLPESSYLQLSDYNAGMDLLQIAGFQGPGSTDDANTDAVRWQFSGLPFNAVVPPVQTNHSLAAPGMTTRALGVNDLLQADTVGFIQPRGEFGAKPVLWKNDVLTPLGNLGGRFGKAYSINNHGTVVGWAEDGGFLHRAFRWTAAGNPQMVSLGTLSQRSTLKLDSEAFANNNMDQITGWSYNEDGAQCAFLWTPNATDGDVSNIQMKILIGGYQQGIDSAGLSLNDKGQVVGRTKQLGGVDQAFFWSAATGVVLLPNLTNSSVANSINNQGVIAGTSISADGTPHAVTWTHFLISDLNNSILNPTGWVLTTATGINSRGDIVCNGYEAATPGSSYGILLTENLTLSVYPPPYPTVIKYPFYNIYDPWWWLHLWDNSNPAAREGSAVSDVAFLANMAEATSALKDKKIKKKLQVFLMEMIQKVAAVKRK